MPTQKRERSRTSRPLSMLFADSFTLFKKSSSANSTETPAVSKFPEIPSRTSVAAPPSPPRSHHASASTASTASSFDTADKPYLTLSLDHHPSAASLVPEHLLDDSRTRSNTASTGLGVTLPTSPDVASTRTSLSLASSSSRRVSKNHGVYIYLGNSEFSEEEAFNPFDDLA